MDGGSLWVVYEDTGDVCEPLYFCASLDAAESMIERSVEQLRQRLRGVRGIFKPTAHARRHAEILDEHRKSLFIQQETLITPDSIPPESHG